MPPSSPPRIKEIADQIHRRLAKLNPEDYSYLRDPTADSEAPSCTYRSDSWQVKFLFIPKQLDLRGRQSARPLKGFSTKLKNVNHPTTIKKVLLGKARSYGKLDKPFVVAVNAQEFIDDIYVSEALVGSERMQLEGTWYGKFNLGRAGRPTDGFWIHPNGATNRHISAVLIANRLQHWGFEETSVRIYHNPWAKCPLSTGLFQLPQIGPKGNEIAGKSLGEILKG